MKEILETERKVQLRAVFSFLLIIGILCVTALGVLILVANKRKAEEEDKKRMIPAAEVVIAEPSEYQIKIFTQGVVESTRETQLAAEVRGRVMEISENLKRGGRVKKGERLVQIDPSDYRALLATAEVNLANAELALEQEKARVEQAELDWKRLGRGSASPLVLRKPQLAAAEAMVASAREDVARARRDVERTEILAPFDASVREAMVEVGAVAAAGSMVAQLYTTEELEVRLPLSLEDFGFLGRDENGDAVGDVLVKGKIGTREYEWPAEISRVDPEIDRKTLSANIVVKVMAADRVNFPLPPVGLFVEAEIGGQVLEDVVEIPRRALMDGNQVIVVGDGSKIEFREVEVIRLTETQVVIHEGIAAEEKIVVTRLSAPVLGMEVEVEKSVPEGGE